jgi:hypothetical protein
MDLNKAIEYAQLVNAAYAVLPGDLKNRAGGIVQAGLVSGGIAYEVVTSIYANDLATDMNQPRGKQEVSIGLILQASATGDVVIALRGTEGIMEWVQDAKFGAVPCPFLTSGGKTEDGFTDVYESMAIDQAGGKDTLAKVLPTIAWKKPVTSLTICGHSLGGALATLLALDVAANSPAPFNDPTAYTYASPKTGDPAFVSTYNHVVPNTLRIANRVDLVPKLPLPPLYDHVSGLFEVSPVKLIPPAVLIKFDIRCEHILTSYLHLLSLLAGGMVLNLDANCVP